MTSLKWTLLSIAPLMFCAACTHKSPIAAQITRPVPAAIAPAATSDTARAVSAAPTRSTQTATRQSAPAQRQPTTMTPQDRETLNQRLAHLEDALFDYDKTSIRSDAQTALHDDVTVIRVILASYPGQKLLIEGHADQRGSSEYNLALGERRARATEEFLSGMGIPQTQLAIVSYGKEMPVCSDSTEACWQQNRRAHITAAR